MTTKTCYRKAKLLLPFSQTKTLATKLRASKSPLLTSCARELSRVGWQGLAESPERRKGLHRLHCSDRRSGSNSEMSCLSLGCKSCLRRSLALFLPHKSCSRLLIIVCPDVALCLCKLKVRPNTFFWALCSRMGEKHSNNPLCLLSNNGARSGSECFAASWAWRKQCSMLHSSRATCSIGLIVR